MKAICRFLLVLGMMLGVLAWASEGSERVYSVDGKDYEGVWFTAAKQDAAHPSSRAALIILVHDWDGLTAYERERGYQLAQLGYNVFAVDMFGKGVRPTELDEKKRLTGDLYKHRDKMEKLLEAGVSAAIKQGGNANNMVVMGYCFGGSVALQAARSGLPAQGFVTFHGGLKTPEGEDYSKVTAPLLILHGAVDQVSPVDEFAALSKALEAAGAANEMILYGGARHAFTEPGERYNKVADMKSWARFKQFLTARTVLD